VYLSLLATVHIFLLITRSRAEHMKMNSLIKVGVGLVVLSLLGSLVPFATDQYGKLGGYLNVYHISNKLII
jgi:multisubunit Na+/H+ antiporter MnhB subunit